MITKFSELVDNAIVIVTIACESIAAKVKLVSGGAWLLSPDKRLGVAMPENDLYGYFCKSNNDLISTDATGFAITVVPGLLYKLDQLRHGMHVTAIIKHVKVTGLIWFVDNQVYLIHNESSIGFHNNTLKDVPNSYKYNYLIKIVKGTIFNICNPMLSSLVAEPDIRFSELATNTLVSCYLNNQYIENALFVKVDNGFYIFHNVKACSSTCIPYNLAMHGFAYAYYGVVRDDSIFNSFNSWLTNLTVLSTAWPVKGIIKGLEVRGELKFKFNNKDFIIFYNTADISHTTITKPGFKYEYHGYCYRGKFTNGCNPGLTQLIPDIDVSAIKPGTKVELFSCANKGYGTVYCVTESNFYIANDMISNCDCVHDGKKVYKGVINNTESAQNADVVLIRPVVDVAVTRV